MKDRQIQNFTLFLLFLGIQTISCQNILLSALDAACDFSTKFEQFSRNIASKQVSLMNAFESVAYPELVRKKRSMFNQNMQTAHMTSIDSLLEENAMKQHVDENQASEQEWELNSEIQSRRMLQQGHYFGPMSSDWKRVSNINFSEYKWEEIDKDDFYLQEFFKNRYDNFIHNLYSVEKGYYDNLLFRKDNEEIDSDYFVPSRLVYEATYKNVTYKVVKVPDACSHLSQKVIYTQYFYICEDVKVHQAYYFFSRDEKPCHKVKAYIEGCKCPKDKFGVFCNEPMPISCFYQQHNIPYLKNQDVQNDGSEFFQHKPTQIFDDASRLGMFYNKVQKFNKDGFNFTLNCTNLSKAQDILERRRLIVDGLCPQTLAGLNPGGCYPKEFQYTHSAPHLLLSENVRLSYLLHLSNWKKVSAPLTLNNSISSPSLEILTGKQSMKVPILLDELSKSNPLFNKNDYIQYGQMWYSLNIIIQFSQSEYTSFDISIGSQNGILKDINYEQPRLNYFQLLTINRWALVDYIIVLLTIFLIIAFGLLVYFVSQSIHKVHPIRRCLAFLKLSTNYLQQQQSSSSYPDDGVYNNLHEF